EHEGPQGKIKSAWKRVGKKVNYSVTIPANSTATVYFPLQQGQKAYQGKSSVEAILSLDAGTYQFEIR
ncbi:MAG: hypothetical protein EOO00_14195, partial [Chitinophagaceae bacterium]